MSRSVRSMGLCLVAAFAFGAMTVASAQAKDVTSGPIPFTDAGTGTAELGNSLVNIKCTAHHAAGEVTSASGGTAVSTYEGCEAVGKGVKCTSAGAKEAEIVTKELVEEIGWISQAKNEVGNLFKPASGPGGTLAEFSCGATVGEVKVYGSVIGKLTSKDDEMAETSTYLFEGTGFKNTPTKLEGETEEHFLETEFPKLAPGSKVSSEQKQGDNVTNHGGECSVSNGKEKCKLKDPAEIGTDEVQCEEKEVEVTKGKTTKIEKVVTCKVATRVEPEYGRCEKKKGGLYKNSECTEAAEFKKGVSKGKYEFEPAT